MASKQQTGDQRKGKHRRNTSKKHRLKAGSLKKRDFTGGIGGIGGLSKNKKI